MIQKKKRLFYLLSPFSVAGHLFVILFYPYDFEPKCNKQIRKLQVGFHKIHGTGCKVRTLSECVVYDCEVDKQSPRFAVLHLLGRLHQHPPGLGGLRRDRHNGGGWGGGGRQVLLLYVASLPDPWGQVRQAGDGAAGARRPLGGAQSRPRHRRQAVRNK